VIVSCPKCNFRYQYDESRFGEAKTKRLKCSKCDSIFEVQKPAVLPGGDDRPVTRVVPPPRAEETTKELDARSLRDEVESSLPDLAPLPPNRRYSLAVILGAGAGQIFQVGRPRVILGRGAGCDVQLQDSETSRKHAMLEIHDDDAALTDLESTNGTFVGGVRIQKTTIRSHQEFSLGATTLMFIVTEMQEAH
jgi:hypothetical protein